MLNDRLKGAQMVRSDLLPTEVAGGDFYAQLFKLGHTYCEARRAANLPIQIGQAELGHIAAAISHTHQAMGHLVDAHGAMAETLGKILPGVPTRMVGDPCPFPPASAEEQDSRAPRLAIVD